MSVEWWTTVITYDREREETHRLEHNKLAVFSRADQREGGVGGQRSVDWRSTALPHFDRLIDARSDHHRWRRVEVCKDFIIFILCARKKGEHQPIEVTKWVWASMVFWQRFWATAHIRSVLSSATDKRYLPPGWKRRPRTQLSWPISNVNGHYYTAHTYRLLQHTSTRPKIDHFCLQAESHAIGSDYSGYTDGCVQREFRFLSPLPPQRNLDQIRLKRVVKSIRFAASVVAT